jgi:hypothetical protein
MNTSNLTNDEVKETWQALFPRVPSPSNDQWALWLIRHNGPTVRKGLCELAAKYQRLHGEMDHTWMLKFASSVMNRITRERESDPLENRA